jgi:RHS repeat-associated protein
MRMSRFAFLLCLTGFASAGWGQQSPNGQSPQSAATYANLPLQFEQNLGQTDTSVQFLSRGPGYTAFFTANEAVFVLRPPTPTATNPPRNPIERINQLRALNSTPSKVIRMKLVGADTSARASGESKLPGTVNYFIGNDPTKWHTDIPTYSTVRFAGVYPNSDLVYYGNQRQLEYDLVVNPGGDPKNIAFTFEGADSSTLDSSGDFRLMTTVGELRLTKPAVYQIKSGQRVNIDGRFESRSGNAIGLNIGTYDPSQPLIIDPVLVYSTLLGGTGYNTIQQSVADPSGNVFIVGYTSSSDFPTGTTISPPPTGGGYKLFLAKLNFSGTGLIYSTYLGGTSGSDIPWALAIDANGYAYTTGSTCSTDFPVTATAYQLHLASNVTNCSTQDAFLAKLSADGRSLLYSTYFGGTGVDTGLGVAVDANQNAYFEGRALSTNFPITSNAFQTTNKSSNGNAFVARIDTTRSGSSSLIYSTYLGGHSRSIGQEGAQGIAADAKYNAYVTGLTCSSDFPITQSAYQTSGSPDQCSGFLSQIDTTKSGTSSLVYSTYFGGKTTGDYDSGQGLVLDSRAYVYITGTTYSPDFPTTNGSRDVGTTQNTFVAKFNTGASQLSSLLYSTVVAASAYDTWMAVDANGHAYVAGWTNSPNYPVTPGAIQSTFQGSTYNSFLTVLSPDASSNLYSTYLGGADNSAFGGVSLDSNNNIYIGGEADSSTFPTTTGAFQTTFTGSADGFIIKLTSGSWDPTITNISPSEGPTGTSVTIIGANFGSSRGSSTLTFNGTVATSISTWASTSIVATVPTGATTGDVIVTISGARNADGHTFTVTSSSSGSPFISSLSPSQGAVGTSVSIIGTSFGSSGVVKFNGVAANTSNWTSTGITATVPSGATTGDVIVTVSNVQSNAMDFDVTGSSGTSSSDIYFYFSDTLGTSRIITASDGTVCYDADTYPFGGERAYKDNCDSAYKFTGKERDPESGLDNFGARYDSSQYGRFMTPDWSDDPDTVPYGDFNDPRSLNLYSFVRNNPLTLTDPDGHTCSRDEKGNFFGDCSNLGDELVTQSNQSQTPDRVTVSNNELNLMMLQSVGDTLSSPRQWADLAKNGLENTTQVGLVAGALEQCALATCSKTNITLAALPMLGPLSEELGVSIRNLKHITQHVHEFAALDSSLGLKEVVSIGQDVAKTGTQVGTRAWEKTIQIGQETVTVRAYNNTNGVLRSVYIKK